MSFYTPYLKWRGAGKKDTEREQEGKKEKEK